ncbi:MAG: ATP-binding protein [Ilumatobacter sp.]|uniref:ATP-binding protein n=1 Tax=Ilumatobacter sp. TaxID=1967498 RepID=UPI003C793E2E
MGVPESSERDRQLTVSAEFKNLGRLREHVATAAHETGASDDIVEQLQLVVSELATNAMQYNDADMLTVSVRGDDSSWTIEVSNADGLAEIDAPALPNPDVLAGRGLFLVDAVMDRVELVDIDGRLHVRCVKFAG